MMSSSNQSKHLTCSKKNHSILNNLANKYSESNPMNDVENVVADAKNRVLIIENRNSKHQHHRSIDKTKETADGFLIERLRD